ncbi:MAG: PDZ domain-containing protein [Pirellula sp.]
MNTATSQHRLAKLTTADPSNGRVSVHSWALARRQEGRSRSGRIRCGWLPLVGMFSVTLFGWLAPATTQTAAPSAAQPPEPSVQAGESATSVVSPSAIREWISDLASDDFATRETATRKISNHLEMAMPLLIEATDADVRLQSEGLLQFLGFLGRNADTAQGQQAYACLNRLASERTTYRAVVAQKILENISLEMRDLTVLELRRLGAFCENRILSVLTKKEEVKNALVIDRSFVGTPEDLKLLKWLVDVKFVKLEGPLIDREVLECVVQMPRIERLQIFEASLTSQDLLCLRDIADLQLLEILYTPVDDSCIDILEQVPIFGDLQLFGTDLSAQGAKEIVDRIDTADVFVGRGGFLGITCEPSSLVIRDVIIDGPAYHAGIRTLDKLLKVDGVSISNFDDLRRELAKSASGESVIVEFERPWIYMRRNGNPGRDLPLELESKKEQDDEKEQRNGERFKVKVTLGRRPSDMSP